MPALLVAQQVAGSANVEIVAGKLETRAQRIEIAQHLQPLLRHFGQLRAGGVGEIGVSAQFRSTHASAQLVELRKAEAIGAVDDDGVCTRDIEPGFDDRCGQQHIVLALVEGAHPLLDFGRAHLAMRADEFELRHRLAKPFLQLFHVGDTGHDDEALPTAMVLAQQCLAHHHLVPFHDVGAHGQPIDRRRLDGAEFAQTRHRHLQGARDRRGRQRQHVHVGAQRLQLLLVGDAEALLLVHHDEPQILELRGLGEDRVRADDDVHRPVRQLLAGFLRFLGRHEAREAADLQREAGKAFLEIGVMLAGEQGGGRDHGNLLPVHRRDEGGAQGDFGFAETDIAADKPVHRFAGFQIAQHIGDGAILIVGLLPREAVDELVVDLLLGFQHRRFLQRAFGGHLHQLAGDLANALLQLGAAALPRLAAQPVQHHRFLAAAIAA